MNSGIINRRRLLVAATGVGLGTSVSAPAAPQRALETKLPFPPKDFGAIHTDTMDKISSSLGGSSIDTRDGLLKVVDLLRRYELVSEDDANLLRELIRAMFSSSSIET